MIKIGHINDAWIDVLFQTVMSATGYCRPKEGGIPEGVEGHREWNKAIEAGYDPTTTYFEMFNLSNLDFDVPKLYNRDQHWWITKIAPGQFMPMHIDPHTEQQDIADRLWIPLQDWQLGHVFMYEDTVVTDYKKGDIFQYQNSQAVHGAANIGHVPRVVLQITLIT